MGAGFQVGRRTFLNNIEIKTNIPTMCGIKETAKNAKYILKKLKEKKQNVWTKNDILQKCRTLNAAKIGEALELLDEMNYIRLIEERTKTKTKLTIRANPLIFDK